MQAEDLDRDNFDRQLNELLLDDNSSAWDAASDTAISRPLVEDILFELLARDVDAPEGFSQVESDTIYVRSRRLRRTLPPRLKAIGSCTHFSSNRRPNPVMIWGKSASICARQREAAITESASDRATAELGELLDSGAMLINSGQGTRLLMSTDPKVLRSSKCICDIFRFSANLKLRIWLQRQQQDAVELKVPPLSVIPSFNLPTEMGKKTVSGIFYGTVGNDLLLDRGEVRIEGASNIALAGLADGSIKPGDTIHVDATEIRSTRMTVVPLVKPENLVVTPSLFGSL